jgi:diguanylate cyclase (GGDEF)-like protein
MLRTYFSALGNQRFDPAVESRYQNDLAQEKVRTFVRTNILCALLQAAFSILDAFAISSGLHAAWIIRSMIITLNLSCCVWVARNPERFVRHYTAVVASLYLVWGIAIEYVIAISTPSDLSWHTYYAGLILVSMALYSGTYLRPTVAICVGILLVGTYWGLAVKVQKMCEREEIVALLANTFFLTSANLIGLFSMLTRERFARRAFQFKEHLRRDIEKGEQIIREGERVAEHDPLTGLLNRAGFQRRLDELLDHSLATSDGLGLIFIDLDGFKPINDAYGHAAGDALLQAVAKSICHALRARDLVGRMGGDEFVVALPLAGQQETDLQRVVEALAEAVCRPIEFNGQALIVQASLGMATSREYGFDGLALMQAADERMYEHKRCRKRSLDARGSA